MLRVALFGVGRLFADAAEIKLPSRMWTLPLLAYLLFHRGEMIPRHRVAFTLWPDEPEEVALRNLRRNLHRLTQALPQAPDGVPWVVANGHNISWNLTAPLAFDVAEFELLRADPATLERAVAQYAGDLLAETNDDWIAAERECLRQSYHADLSALIVINRSRRAFSIAAAYAQRLLGADPWHEDALRHLMSIRYESGDAAGAAAEFELFATRLRAEMRVEPMPETLALRDAIARGAPIPSLPAEAEAQQKREGTVAPFVGRTEELARLRGRWLRAAGGKGGFGFVRGDAGIGKSRLVSELALITEAEGGRVIAGTTSSPERAPYQCLSTALWSALPLVAGTTLASPLLAAIAELVPELRSHRPDIPQLARLDPKGERARLIDALTQAFVALARPRPLLVILEDLHRAGAATLEALGEIVPRLSRSAVLMLATYRPDEAGRNHPLRAVERALHPIAEPLTVGPLGEDEVAKLVEAVAPGILPTADFIERLTRRSQGNPLFVTELIRDVSLADAERFVMPANVSAMISGRVASLTPAARLVAEVAAVAGESFTVEIVREIAGLPEGELLDRFDELLDRHLIRESTERGRYEYAFTHHLIHAAIYDAMPEGSRSRRHRRVARILDGGSNHGRDEFAADIALHYERGGDPLKAAPFYAAAGRRAAQLHANAEARDLVTRALALGQWDARTSFELLMLRSRMNSRLASADDERADLTALEAFSSKVDDEARCAALVRHIEVAIRYNDRVAEGEAVERLEKLALATDSERWLAAAAEARARFRHRELDFARALDDALEARDRYRALGDAAACACATALAAHISCLVPARADDAQALADDALRLADPNGNAEVFLETLGNLGVVAQERQDYPRMVEVNRTALALCLRVGDRAAESHRRGSLGIALWGCWRFAEALHELQEALRLCEALGMLRVLPTVMCNIGGLLLDVGDYEPGGHWLERAAATSLETGAVATALVALSNLADVYWQTCRLDALRNVLERSAAISERLPESRYQASFLLNRGRLLRCERAFGDSLEVLERAVTLLAGTGRWADSAETLDDLALTHLGDGNAPAARDALRRGAELVGDRSHTYPIRHLWIEACTHRAAGEHALSRRSLQQAHGVFTEQVARLEDPALRVPFEAIPVHRAVRAAFSRDEWPAHDVPCLVAFATVGTVEAKARRPSRPSR